MKLTQSQVGIYFGNSIIRVRTKLCFLILGDTFFQQDCASLSHELYSRELSVGAF